MTAFFVVLIVCLASSLQLVNGQCLPIVQPQTDYSFGVGTNTFGQSFFVTGACILQSVQLTTTGGCVGTWRLFVGETSNLANVIYSEPYSDTTQMKWVLSVPQNLNNNFYTAIFYPSSSCGASEFWSLSSPYANGKGFWANSFYPAQDMGFDILFCCACSDSNNSPVLSGCGINQSFNTDPGQCCHTQNYATPTATDADSCAVLTGPSRTAGLASGSCFPTGSNGITYQVIDSASNSATCSWTYTVNDAQAPTITCPASFSVNANPGQCRAQPTFTPTATDNCAVSSITSTPASGSNFNVGTTTVTSTATDVNGRTSSCTFTVTVVDNQNPSFTFCPSSFTVNPLPGQCFAVVNYPAATATDNCAISSITYSILSGSTLPTGPHPITVTATDINGRTSTCSFTVTVIDLAPPVVQCPTSLDFSTGPGRCDAVATFFVSAQDPCGVNTVVSTPASGSVFQLGTTFVTTVATDYDGNTATCVFPLTVYDRQAPVLTCPTDVSVNAINGQCSNTVTYSPIPAFVENCASRIGTYDMTLIPFSSNDYTGTNVFGGPVDDILATIDMPFTFTYFGTSQTQVIVSSNGYIQFPGTCTNTGGFGAGCCQGQSVFTSTCPTGFISGWWQDLYVDAATLLTYRTDGVTPNRVFVISYNVRLFGNLSAFVRFQIRLFEQDNIIEVHYETVSFDSSVNSAGIQSPLSSTGNQFFLGTSGYFPAPLGVRYVPIVPTVTALTKASGSSFPVGTTQVTYSAIDSFGSHSSCDWSVNVLDNQPPTITCPTINPITVSPPLCSATVVYPAITTSDNCGVSSTIINPASGYNFPVGTTTVTATVIDNSGRTVSCTFPVTVLDPSNGCLCGNGKVDSGEQCEINQLGSATCIALGFTLGGVLDCTDCKYDTSRCAVCGDNRIDGTEICDGSNLNSQTCLTVPGGFTSGVLACNAGCNGYVTSGCTKCGDNIIQGVEECDGTNLNGRTCLTQLGTSSGGGTLSCSNTCTFNTSSCIVPVVSLPSAGLVIDHQTFGIRVKATGFANDRKVTVTLSDGIGHSKAYTGISLALPAGSLDATMQAPSPLAPSSNWKVSVKGETSLFIAYSGVFTVRSL